MVRAPGNGAALIVDGLSGEPLGVGVVGRNDGDGDSRLGVGLRLRLRGATSTGTLVRTSTCVDVVYIPWIFAG